MQNSESNQDLLKQFEPVALDQLNDSLQKQVTACQRVFSELNRLIKSITLYGEAHQSSLNFRSRFFEVMSEALTECGSLTIEVQMYALVISDQVIYEDARIEGNFIYRFYSDGIRTLTFKPGISPEEVDELLKLFLLDWSNPALFEDDSVTLMWSKGFEFIEYTVAVRYDEDTQEADAHLFNFTDELNRLSDLCATSPHGITLPLSRPELPESEQKRLEQLSRMSQRELLEKLISFTHETQSDQAQISGTDRFVQLSDQLAQLFAQTTQISELERLLRQVLFVATAKQRSQCMDLWAVPVFIRNLMTPLRSVEHPEALSSLACLHVIGELAVPHIARSLGEVSDSHIETLLQLIKPHIELHPVELFRVVRSSDYLHVKRLLPTLYSASDDQFCLKLFETGWAHEDQGVRYESLLGLPERLFAAPQLIRRLLDGLHDSYSKIRTLSCFRLSKLKDQGSRDALKSHLNQENKGQDVIEVRKLYAALAMMGESPLFFIELLNKKSSAFSFSKLSGQGSIENHGALIGLAITGVNPQHASHLDEIRASLAKESKRKINGVLAEPARWGEAYLEVAANQRDQMVYELFFRNQLTPPKRR